MDGQAVTYKKPKTADILPRSVVEYLDGSKLSERIGGAIRLSTVDADGWSHAALLSVGEIWAVDDRHVNFGIWESSTTAKNIERTGRVSMELVHDGSLWEIHLNAKRARRGNAGAALAFFTTEVKSIRVHNVDYAEVVSSITYRLHDPDSVVKRWEQQLDQLRACA